MTDLNEVMSLDIGEQRIGIARATFAAKIPEPLATTPTVNALEAINGLIGEHGTQAIVAGLPRGLDGQETAQTKWVRHWVRDAQSRIKLPWYWQDEAVTSELAKEYISSHQKELSADQIDAVAACIILEDFLDTSEEKRIIC